MLIKNHFNRLVLMADITTQKNHKILKLFVLFFTFTFLSNQTLALNIKATSYFLFDYATGKTLLTHNATQKREVASLTKLMTAYVVLKKIKEGDITLHDMVRVSYKADATGGSSLGLKQNELISVENLLKGLIVRSGNDAAVALAEYISKSEAQFVIEMNQYAKQLGMKQSRFANSNGFPSKKPQYSTARDMGILSQALILEFPKAYQDIFSARYYNEYQNRNKLVYKGYADGLKTGHTRKAGYCLVASRKENNTRFISVLLNTKTKYLRTSESKTLLSYGFKNFETTLFYEKDEKITQLPIQNGEQKRIKVGVSQSIRMTLKKGQANKAMPAFKFIDNQVSIKAPIQKGDVVGYLYFNQVTALKNKKWPIIALETVKEGTILSWLKQLWQ